MAAYLVRAAVSALLGLGAGALFYMAATAFDGRAWPWAIGFAALGAGVALVALSPFVHRQRD